MPASSSSGRAPWVVATLLVGCVSEEGGDGAGAAPHDGGGRAAAEAGTDASGDVSSPAGVRFLDLRVEGVTASRAVVRFDTDVETTCEVEFGTSAATLDRSATDPDMPADDPYDVTHEVPLEDLTPGTEHFFQAKAVTPSGETFRSELSSFWTLPAEAGAALVNVALLSSGARVTALSSSFGGTDGAGAWGAHNAFDGSMATEWATQGDGDDAFVEIDLGREVTVVAVGFRSRKMADGSSVITRFSVVADGGTTLGPFDAPDPDQRTEHRLSEPVTGRMFRFEAVASTGGNAGAKEIELLAEPTP